MPAVLDDFDSNPSDNETFAEVLDGYISRRSILRGGVIAAAGAFLTLGAPGGVMNGVAQAARRRPLVGFTSIPVGTADAVVVPPGYTSRVLIAWGDPVGLGPAFLQDASQDWRAQEQQWGMHNDGLHFFPLGEGGGKKRGLLVQNHEYTDDALLFADGVANWNADKTRKSQAAHGVGIIEVNKVNGQWQIRKNSPYARRITAYTPMTFAGPAAGHALLKTAADPNGTNVLGTFNNCAHGFTPWGTYLACEENFNGYFKRPSASTATPLEARYGIGTSSTVLWYTTDTRFAVDLHPNEPNRFGWVVEIDPFDKTSTPVKRTALGRLKHEGAWVVETADQRVVVYSGDDQTNEYIYRYVSTEPWPTAIANGRSPLDDGILYVGKFNADGTGEWLPLTIDNPNLTGFDSQGDILIRARQAADQLGATKMDRPEWIDVDKKSGWVYCTLTNNSTRGTTGPAPDAANPRASNVYGHIVRWRYANDFSEPTFYWEIFALGGDPDLPAHGSTIEGDKYGSPDGIYCAPSGRLWIQTDVSTSTINTGAYAGFGNNQMLCADPVTKETRRFLVGPKQCEVTGVVVTPDERTMFVGIQHPGEPGSGNNDPANPKAFSSWPDGAGGGRPRSAMLVITKDDGGQIGS